MRRPQQLERMTLCWSFQGLHRYSRQQSRRLRSCLPTRDSPWHRASCTFSAQRKDLAALLSAQLAAESPWLVLAYVSLSTLTPVCLVNAAVRCLP